jgi:hypothetical protein
VSQWSEYIAAGLLDAVTDQRAWEPDKLSDFFERRYGLSVDVEEISAAVDILSDCGLAFTEEDPFAGRFIKIARPRYKAFLDAVDQERDPNFEGRKMGPIHAAVSSAFSTGFGAVIHRPNLDKYNKYMVLKRYHEFGQDFIKKAISALSSSANEHTEAPKSILEHSAGSAVSEELIPVTDAFGVTLGQMFTPTDGAPASDRIVFPSDNQDAYDQSIASLENLENELKTSNEAGDIFGDDRELATQELSLLRNLISGARVRAEPAITLAKKSLGWIAEKAGAAAIGDMAKRALGFLIEWLSG